MNAVELGAAAFGVLYVILAVKSNPWCWMAGIVSSALYIFFDLQLKYYQDGILQLYYVLAGVYGWYLWTKISNPSEMSSGHRLIVQSYSYQKLIPVLILGAVLTPAFGYLFSRFGNSYSYIDSFTTVFSFIATYLTAKKIIESWQMWVLIDLVLILQYFLKGAYVSSGLYLFLAIMAFYGYLEWQKQIRTS